jgi:hypothetical protein
MKFVVYRHKAKDQQEESACNNLPVILFGRLLINPSLVQVFNSIRIFFIYIGMNNASIQTLTRPNYMHQ